MSVICPDRHPNGSQAGFAMVSAIFIIVVLAALAGFVVSTTSTQNVTLAQDVQGVRVYQAAQAGIEWGISRWQGAADCTNGSSLLSFAGTGLADFTTTVTRTQTTSGGVNFCNIVSTATSTSVVGSITFVERVLSAVIEQ